MTQEIVLEQFYAFPPERVWRALTEPEVIAQWNMENDFQPRVGHKFQFRAQPMPGWNGIVDCEVIALDEPHTLAYSWKSSGNDTVVTWTLEPRRDGTLLRLAHTGFKGPEGAATAAMLRNGWNKMLETRFGPVVAALDLGTPRLPEPDCKDQ